MYEARSAITINELNMARRQCLRLITVDETTVSSSRSSSSSRFLLLHRIFVAPLSLSLLPHSSTSPLALAASRPFPAMSLIFSSLFPAYLLFFLRILLISFHSVLRSAFSFSPGAASSLLLPPSVSPSFSSLHSAPDPSSSGSLPHRGPFLLLPRTGNTRVRRPPRVSTQRSAS